MEWGYFFSGLAGAFVGILIGMVYARSSLRDTDPDRPPLAKPDVFILHPGQVIYGRYNSVTQQWELITEPEEEST
jgi:hypothetical protein